ncbi:MAG TPA: MSMEG_3727 family PQQ-associated protein [Woeseiaceae bacterium]|nr:MSMEG_3727 family PQQ-associated protein [Woeseiaceae bacterium]
MTSARTRWPVLTLVLVLVVAGLSSCEYGRLLRPSVLSQLNPRVVQMVNYLPAVDHPNEAILARLFVHGGLSHATLGNDGVFRDEIFVPKNELIWEPAVIVMEKGGELELTFSNGDQTFHRALMPTHGGRKLLDLPMHEAGVVRIRLDQPGLYWFGCPVANHAGRGMLGLVVVEGEVPADARLDRPAMPRPGSE